MKSTNLMLFLSFLILTAAGNNPSASAAEKDADHFPAPEWHDTVNPFASPDAETGGTLTVFAGQAPQSFNYYLDNNVFSAELFGSMYESLLNMDPVTLQYVPGLAEKWIISADKQTFTFVLNPAARWSDGKPVTSEDVAWTFNTILSPENMTGVHKVSLEAFEPPQIIDEHTIIFRAANVHWRNLGAVGGFEILPRHVYADKDFNTLNTDFPVVSGPYRISRVEEGVRVEISRRDDYWARKKAANRYLGNFSEISFRFYAERENAFEAFRRGLVDIFPVYTARLWVKATSGERFDKNWIVKQNVFNHQPQGFQGFAMNMRRKPFDDRRVRLALAHLLDREKMNRTLMFDQYIMQRSYFEDLYDTQHPNPNMLIPFDKSAARKLLAAAGWKTDPQTGILKKNGEPFVLRFLTRDPSSDKFLAIYANDLKDVGIELKIDRKDWAAWSRDMDNFHYDMTWAAWGAAIFKDPEGMWASSEAERQSGNNITGFKSAEVDRLIEEQKTIFDVNQRHAICREIDRLIVEQCPYILLWNSPSSRLLYWNKFGTPPTVLGKYGRENSANWLWWYDYDAAAALEDAMNGNAYLPPRPAVIHFDDIFNYPVSEQNVNLEMMRNE